MALVLSISFFLIICPSILTVQMHNHVGFIKFSVSVPVFLSNLSLKAQYDYKLLLENETMPIQVKNSDFVKWANVYNVSSEFASFATQQNATRVQFNKNVTQVISQLSLVNTQVSKILDNSTLSIENQREAVEDLNEQFSQEISTLLFIRRLFDSQDVLSSKHSTV